MTLGCKSMLQRKFQKIYQNWQAFSQLDTIKRRKQSCLEQIPINSPNQVVNRQYLCRLWWLFVQTSNWHSDGNRLCAIFSRFVSILLWASTANKNIWRKGFWVSQKVQFYFRYLDDLLCINSYQLMDSVMQDIYPKELEPVGSHRNANHLSEQSITTNDINIVD